MDSAVAAASNDQGTFTFVKGPQPQMQTGLTGGGFTNVCGGGYYRVTINFTP